MSEEDGRRALSSLRKQRGVVKRSITLKTLKAMLDDPSIPDQAKQLVSKLQDLDKEFWSVHFEVINLFEEQSPDLEREHEVLDKHEDDVTAMSLRLQKLVTPNSVTGYIERGLSRKLAWVERRLRAIEEALARVTDDHDDVTLLEQHQE